MHHSSFNIVVLAKAVVLVALLLCLTLPLAQASGRSSSRMQNSTQLRGIHQGLFTYANSNRNFFPGIDKGGKHDGIDVEERYAALLDGDFFTPQYAISPIETDSAIHEWDPTLSGPVTADHYSFAMLQVPEAGGRYDEWQQTLNAEAVVVADRNTGTASTTYGYHNEHTETSSAFGCTTRTRQPYLSLGHWRGQVLWNDNHVEIAKNDMPDTIYGGVATTKDQLFSSANDDDALLIHSGN